MTKESFADRVWSVLDKLKDEERAAAFSMHPMGADILSAAYAGKRADAVPYFADAVDKFLGSNKWRTGKVPSITSVRSMAKKTGRDAPITHASERAQATGAAAGQLQRDATKAARTSGGEPPAPANAADVTAGALSAAPESLLKIAVEGGPGSRSSGSKKHERDVEDFLAAAEKKKELEAALEAEKTARILQEQIAVAKLQAALPTPLETATATGSQPPVPAEPAPDVTLGTYPTPVEPTPAPGGTGTPPPPTQPPVPPSSTPADFPLDTPVPGVQAPKGWGNPPYDNNLPPPVEPPFPSGFGGGRTRPPPELPMPDFATPPPGGLPPGGVPAEFEAGAGAAAPGLLSRIGGLAKAHPYKAGGAGIAALAALYAMSQIPQARAKKAAEDAEFARQMAMQQALQYHQAQLQNESMLEAIVNYGQHAPEMDSAFASMQQGAQQAQRAGQYSLDDYLARYAPQGMGR
jgi:hypothetical protein